MMEKIRRKFKNPEDEFSPIPFWFWNDDLKESEIKRQIHDFYNKGIMGFVIHPRIGIPKDIRYLSDKFMKLVEFAVEEASELGMKVVLYDEAMYPSGSAHGMVVKENPGFASRGLKMVEYKCMNPLDIIPELDKDDEIILAAAVEKKSKDEINYKSIKKVEIKEDRIVFSPPNKGEWSVLIFIETYTMGKIRGIHFGEDDGEKEAPPSGDLLNSDAVRKFIELTHERYYSILKKYFGTTIIAIFTDEPDILGRNAIKDIRPWTGGFLKCFLEQGNNELDLPVLWFEAGENTANIRKKYFKAVNKRLEISYYSQIYNWCEEHKIGLTGHPHKSDDIGFLKYFHIPGQDIVWRWVAPENNKGIEGVHSTMGKCSADAARHLGRRRNANECFGCCGPDGIHWAFSVDDMKWYLDWLFVRGVNLIYPHAFYYSLNGEKRFGERPPDVGPNNIWWPYYNKISDYIKRLSWLMTDSVNTAKIAVLCEEDCLPWLKEKELYQNQIEFNYLEDNLFVSSRCHLEDGFIKVQSQIYSLLIVESTQISHEVEIKIKKFIEIGGKVIVYNNIYCAVEDFETKEIKKESNIVTDINKFIDKDILIEPHNKDLRFSHVVKEGLDFYLLVNEGEKAIEGSLYLNAIGRTELWDPWHGDTKEIKVNIVENKFIRFPIAIQRRESIIICVDTLNKHIPIMDDKERKPAVFFRKQLKNKWRLSTNNSEIIEIKKMQSWTKLDSLKNYTGTVLYETEIILEDLNSIKRLELDFGKVNEIAKLKINGLQIDIIMWVPYVFDITGSVKEGANLVSIEITNSIVSKMNNIKRESGLIGPVVLNLYK